ncbi:MAG TPA: hypothetical protein VGE08_17420 [Steroidobacter sp.]|uniref:hypothetical protein n=1 Tax=Steroidobacter sp. TaxID=1978227 RepID=UPI002ED77146
MQSFSHADAPARAYRAIVPCDGYVHKFRLEAREEAAAERHPRSQPAPAVHFGSLLGKFVLCGLALIGLAAVGARALI